MEKKSIFDNNIVAILVVAIIFLGITYFSSNDFPISDLRKLGFKMDKYPDFIDDPDIINRWKNKDIEIYNCPNLLIGWSGINSIDWSREYDFKRLNKRVYKLLLKLNDKVELKIKQKRQDSYGKEYFDTYIVGYLDPSEAKKYNNFEAWESNNDLEEIIKDFLINESKNNTTDLGK